MVFGNVEWVEEEEDRGWGGCKNLATEIKGLYIYNCGRGTVIKKNRNTVINL